MKAIPDWFHELRHRKLGPDWLASFHFQSGAEAALRSAVAQAPKSAYRLWKSDASGLDIYLCSDEHDPAAVAGGLPSAKDQFMNRITVQPWPNLQIIRLGGGHGDPGYAEDERNVLEAVLGHAGLTLGDWHVSFGEGSGGRGSIKEGSGKKDLLAYFKFLSAF